MLKILSTVVVAVGAFLIYKVFVQTSVKVHDIFMNSDVKNNGNSRLSSSVWCYFDSTSNKICTFQNLWYIPESKNFIFFLTNESVISGLKSRTDLKTINLSSIVNHNNMFMNLEIVINSHGYIKYNHSVFIHEPVLLVKRFKADNIMHVIHDDILPIFMTYCHLCAGNIEECVFKNRLVFMDESVSDTHLEWYKRFSYKMPFGLKTLKTLACFDKVYVGLSRETVWFQYGFGIPQGPIQMASVNSLIINRFTNYILKSFNIKKSAPSFIEENFINIVLFSRKNNRKMLNENFVVTKISEVFRSVYPEHNKIIKIHILDPSQNKSTDIINAVIRSQVLIGMHGSAMIYSLFLPVSAAIVELFPFGIQPQYVSSTRALCLLPGFSYNYLSWRNFKEINSISHPEQSALLGGIKHLSSEQQKSIEKMKSVPAVECCHDPAYLYRMFQDTIVDESFEVILRQSLINQKEMLQGGMELYFNEYLKSNWFFPGHVSGLSCNVNTVVGKIIVTWNEPYNVKNMFKIIGSVLFRVTIKVFTRIVTLETFSSTVSIQLTAEEKSSTILDDSIQIWIKTVIDDIEGSDFHLYCIQVNQ